MQQLPKNALDSSDHRLKGLDLALDFFELRAKIDEENSVPAALLYRIKDSPLEQSFVIKNVAESEEHFEQALKELAYYLCELPAQRENASPESIWDYQQYHISTAANIYSKVHWGYFPGHAAVIEKSKKLIGRPSRWMLLLRFRREIAIALILLTTQLLFNRFHWLVNFLLLALVIWGARISYQLAVEKSRRKEKLYKRIFWYLMTGFMGISCITIGLSVLFE